MGRELQPEIQASLDDLAKVNPFASAILDAGALVLRNYQNSDHKLDLNRLLRKPLSGRVVLDGLVSAVEPAEPDLVVGLDTFGANFGRKLASIHGIDYLRIGSYFVGEQRHFFLPVNRRQLLEKRANVAVVVGSSRTKERLASFIEYCEDSGAKASPVIVWRRGNHAEEVSLPTNSLPQYLVEFPLPSYISTEAG